MPFSFYASEPKTLKGKAARLGEQTLLLGAIFTGAALGELSYRLIDVPKRHLVKLKNILR